MNKKKKRFETKYIVLIILIIIILLLAFFTYVIKDKRELSTFEKIVKDSITSVNKVIMAPFNYLGDKMTSSNERKNIQEKYNKLKEKEDNFEALEAKTKELENELKELKELLEISSTPSEYSSINATIISRNVGYWYNTITIDKGSHHGIKEDMAVVVGKGLIGKIIKTTNFTSDVKLLTTTDTNNKISIKITTLEKDIYGLLSSYETNTGYFIIEGIADISNIPVESLVTTSGMGGIFPSGIIIGKVKKIDIDNFGLAKKIYVKSEVDFDAIRFVTVLKKKGS